MRLFSRYAIAAICFLAPFAAGAIGGLFTAPNIASWYATLTLPSWTPPAYVFGPVWSALYFLMGVAAALVWLKDAPGRRFSLGIFFAQLALNALWSVVFFGLHAPVYGAAVILMLLLTIAWLIALFGRESKVAAWFLVPYLLWVAYAASLNIGIVLLN